MTGRAMPRWTLLALWGVFLALPVVATMLYSVATVWRGQALPDGFTLSWWTQTLREPPRVVEALMRSTWLAAVTVLVVAAIVLPALYWGGTSATRASAWSCNCAPCCRSRCRSWSSPTASSASPVPANSPSLGGEPASGRARPCGTGVSVLPVAGRRRDGRGRGGTPTVRGGRDLRCVTALDVVPGGHPPTSAPAFSPARSSPSPRRSVSTRSRG